jgi:mono/diheme cytochrome c family protein
MGGLKIRFPLASVFGLAYFAVVPPAAAGVPGDVVKVVETRCAGCHGGDEPEAGVKLDGTWADDRLVSTEGDTWFRALREIESGRMPPEDQEQPSASERALVSKWIRGDLATLQKQHQLSVGRAQVRRLSRTEYADTVFDLFGFRPPVSVDLPEDGRVDGYQKVAKALPLSAASIDGIMRMTDKIVDHLLRPPRKGSGDVKRYESLPSEQSAGHSLDLKDGTHVFFNSTLSGMGGFRFRAGRPGMYRLRISAYGYQTDRPLPFGIYAGHISAYPQLVELRGVLDAPPGKPSVLETDVYLSDRTLNELAPVADGIRLVPLGLGEPVPKNHLASQFGKDKPGLALQWIEAEPLNSPSVGDQWLTADFPPALCAEIGQPKPVAHLRSVKPEEFLAIMKKTVHRMMPRLYRRDPSTQEINAVMALVKADIDAGRRARDIVLDMVRGLLSAPDFFCIIEEPGPLTDFAIASRLSYFLWNSTPDEQLLEVARKRRLSDPLVLREQTDRMLADPKAQRFYKNFAAQWLRLDAIDDTTPDRRLFPEYHAPENDLLKWSSVAETEAFLKRLVDEDASVTELVDSQRVLANSVLARHYGLPALEGSELREGKLPASSPFGGLWTQPAVMKVTANGTNTSPVKRGVFVAERLLGVHIPPPPPNIEPLSIDISAATTLKEKLSLHAGNGSCAACHAKFDGYGYALESFDPAGMFREFYRTTTAETVTWKGPANGSWGASVGAVSTDWTGGNVPGPLDQVAIVGAESGTIVYDKPLYAEAALHDRPRNAAAALDGIVIGNLTPGSVTQFESAADFQFSRGFRPQYRQAVVGPGGRWLHCDGLVEIGGNLLVGGGELTLQGGTFRVLGDTRIGVDAQPAVLAASGEGRVEFQQSFRLGEAAVVRIVLTEKTHEPLIRVRGGGNGSIELGGRLEVEFPRGAKIGGRTFTVFKGLPGGKPITGKFSSQSDSIATVDYAEDSVKITLVADPKPASPANPASTVENASLTSVPRLDMAGLIAVQNRPKGWNKHRSTWRNHLPVESNGSLPDGREFAGIAELRERLAANPDQLAYGLGSHLVTYATGARPHGVDTVALEAIAKQAKPHAHGVRSLIHAVIQSDLFRNK